jgi:serine protease Do
MELQSGLLTDLGQAAAPIAERLRASVVEVMPRRGGAGAGTIWRADGLIVTNYHVAGQERARVRLADGREFEASPTVWDPWNDLTALSIPARELPAAPVGDARTMRPGELVLALGHPYGVRQAVTLGVVSRTLPFRPGGSPATMEVNRTAAAATAAPAAGREARDQARLWRWGEGRELLYADVLLGPGNSGGPLADARGHVVGLNAMVARGLALAVPSHLVERLLTRRGGRPVLGIGVQDVALSASLAARAGGATELGVVVTEVATGSPAERAGLLIGDVLVAVDGWGLEGAEGLLAGLDAHVEGPIRLTLLRAGEVRTVVVPLDRLPGEAGTPAVAEAA